MHRDPKLSDTLMTMLKGAAIGAAILVIVGQFVPGYMLDSNVKLEVAQARQSAIDTSASLLCTQIYKSMPDSEAKLAMLRKGQSYAASQDADVAAASEKAVKLFAALKISPEPYSYRVKSDCGDNLHKSPPSTAAQLK